MARKTGTFTLADFLECYPAGRLLSKSINPSDVVIRHVGVTEGQIKGFVRPMELVLSTAMGYRDEPGGLVAMMQQFLECGVSAVALTFETVSLTEAAAFAADAVAFADEHGLAVVLLPWDLRFSEVVEGVLQHLKRARTDDAEAWKELQASLLTAYVERQGISAAAAQIAQHLGRAVMICAGESIIAYASKTGRVLTPPRERPDSMKELFPVRFQQKKLGALLIDGKLLSASSLQSLSLYSGYILTPLLLWFNREEIIADTRASLLDDFVWQLASDAHATLDERMSRARMLGVSLNRPCCCLVGRLTAINESDLPVWLDTYGPAFKQAVKHIYPHELITIHDEYLVLYLFGAVPGDVVAAIERAHFDNFNEVGLHWGCSDVMQDPDFGMLYREAKLAADLCRIEREPHSLYSPADAELYKLLAPVMNSEDALRVIAKRLAPLLAYDDKQGTNLFHVLYTFMNNQFNSSKTAEELHYHRQSLRYKLKKIAELTGLNPCDFKSTAMLALCLQIHLYAQGIHR